MTSLARDEERPLSLVAAFLALTAALSSPFWVMGGLVGRQFLPGLPLSALAAACPGAAAMLLVARRGGLAAAMRLAGDVGSVGVGAARPAWLATSLATPLAVNAFALLLQVARGARVPDPDVTLSGAGLLAVLFLASAAAEEIGWTAFAVARLRRYGVVGAGLVVGLAWAVWHYPALLQAHRSIAWIAWWTLGTVTARVAMTAIFARAQSVLGAVLFHAMINLSWQLYPVHGSTYDPALSGAVMAVVAAGFVALPRTAAPARS